MTTDTSPAVPPWAGAKVLIGTPTYSGSLHYRFVMSLMGSREHLAEHGVDIAVMFVPSSVLPAARSATVRVALENGFSHLLFADADQAWPADAILRLLRWGKDAVGGVYQSRQDGRFLAFNPQPAGEAPLLEVDAIGAGFLLLSRACLERMWQAWPGRPFEFRHVGGDDPIQTEGEDITFCRRWRAMDGKIYADPSFRMHHFGEQDYNMMLHEALEGGRAKIIDGALCFAGDFRPEFVCRRPSA